ncbi:pyrroline-5-carboxylate reductase [Algoriphagus halophytocola]|uniref:Pyrroline-5-carboxylate reductase n=1 Tax=Algoriphagus halophytocola TaxID=2991499 RepID=A0ABY6MJ84_9BACT|nr:MULTISPECIES: pyrroline-5-carboxylate reductase [unclassified Algoriphagus]UZD23835.1 pyrroline-5-carboxylate reductase [Algoriphagus sp. TR-M5]WBL41202.1 pyrroline-5-carboxylate reductase [Algoriphagus sp. TR-M9]
MLSNQKIAIIGCGNLGASIANGLLKKADFDPKNLILTKRQTASLADFAAQGVQVHSDNIQAAKEADLVILGVKPYNISPILNEIKPGLDSSKIIISLATGVSLAEMYGVLSDDAVAFRAMPNIAADIQESVTCICSNNASSEQVNTVSHLFDAIGFTIPIEENLMEAATVLGACGIAYVLRFMRAMIQGGIQIGFDSVTASKIVNQTVKGAAELMIQKNMHPEAAIDKVTTPKGCTIVGLNEMEHQGFSSAMVRGVIASYDKIAK